MSPQGLVFVAHVLVLLTAGSEVIHGLKFPFGPSAGDTGHLSQSTLGVAVPLPTNFTYYGEAHAKIYANEDGFLSFTKSGLIFDVDKDFGAITFPIICIFCADFKPRNEHKIWSRLSTQASDLQKVQELGRNYQDFGAAFTPTWVFVVTWDEVGTFDPSKLGNTLQIAVANVAGTSLVFMEYDVLNWVEGFTGTGDSISTKVGFTKGDQSSFYAFPQSQNSNITSLNTSSNIGEEGQFLFRVDQDTIPEMPVPTTTTTTTTTTTPIPTTTAPTTAVTVTSTTNSTVANQPADSQWPVQATTLGVGVSVAALLVVAAIVAFVVVRGKARGTPSSAASSSLRKVAPAPPPTVLNGANCHRSRPPVDGVLSLGSPFRIPRPSSSLSRPSTMTSSHLSLSQATYMTSSHSSLPSDRKKMNGGPQPSFMSLVV